LFYMLILSKFCVENKIEIFHYFVGGWYFLVRNLSCTNVYYILATEQLEMEGM
jgi:hypothetical protein